MNEERPYERTSFPLPPFVYVLAMTFFHSSCCISAMFLVCCYFPVVVLSFSSRYFEQVQSKCQQAGLRVKVDRGSERLAKQIRTAEKVGASHIHTPTPEAAHRTPTLQDWEFLYFLRRTFPSPVPPPLSVC